MRHPFQTDTFDPSDPATVRRTVTATAEAGECAQPRPPDSLPALHIAEQSMAFAILMNYS
jgi:hypothetical protein